MEFYVSPQTIGVVFQLPSCRFKGVLDGGMHILVYLACFEMFDPFGRVHVRYGRMQARRALHNNLSARDLQNDAEEKGITILMMPVGNFDHQVTTGDALEGPIEFCGFCADLGGDGIRMPQVSERYL